MSFHILSDQNNVWERTIVYQTFYENLVFIQQKRTNEKEENWTTLEHFMIPKIFINFIAPLTESDDCGGTLITSGGFVPPLSLTHPLYPYDIVTLPKETRTILYKYDCDCVPFFENQLGAVRACNDLADLWGLPHSPESPPPTPGYVSTPTSDPSATVTPESSPSVFPRYRGEPCMEFWLTTNCKSIDAEFVCDRLQNTVWLDDTNNNFGDRFKLGCNNNNNNNNNTRQLRDAKNHSRAKKKKVYWTL